MISIAENSAFKGRSSLILGKFFFHCYTIKFDRNTVLNRTNRMGARLCSKIAFFYRALWKVKVPLCPWSLLIPIELDQTFKMRYSTVWTVNDVIFLQLFPASQCNFGHIQKYYACCMQQPWILQANWCKSLPPHKIIWLLYLSCYP